MRLTKFGHSCLLVETERDRILVDPGSFSHGWETLRGVTAVLVTHQHPDHVDLTRLPGMLAVNADARLFADPATAEQLARSDLRAAEVDAGDTLDLGTLVEVFGDGHATIHRDLPGLPNRGYLIDGRLYLPGDSLQVPIEAVEILGVPVAAPWMALKEAVEFIRAVQPTVAIPIHEKVLASTVTPYALLQRLKPEPTQWLDLDDGRTVTI